MELRQAVPGKRRSVQINVEDTTQVPIVSGSPRRRRRPRRELVVMRVPVLQFSLVSLGTLLVILSIGYAALGREINAAGTLPPGVRIAGAYVGELNVDEARELLTARLAAHSEQPLTLSHGDQVWSPTLADLGASFDLEQSLEDAQYEPSRIDRVRTRLFGADETIIPLRLGVSGEQLERYVASVAAEIDLAPQVPKLTMQDGNLFLTSAQSGIAVEQDLLARSINEALFNLDRSNIEVQTSEVTPDFSDDDVQEVRGLIHEAIGGPITITFEDRSWSLEPAVVAEHLTLRPNSDGEMELAFREDELFAHLDGLIGDINRTAVNARVAWGGSGLVATSPSQDGIERDLGAIFPLLEAAIAGGERQVALPVNRIKPQIDSNNLAELGITSLMAQGESAFWNSSASRAHNIAVAAGYLDGTLVPPGGEFSFNQAIGEISVERGYQEGYVILAEETAPGIGGGVCQVSTTAFRAAFFSGLPITERHPHAYIVGFYEDGGWPLGFDAAIYQPHADLRFSNTTDSYLLIHTHVADQHLYVNIYGPDLGYTVTLGDPVIQNETAPPADVEILDESLAPGARRQVEWAKPGMEVTLPRTVTNSRGEVVRQDYFYSNFQPWGNRFFVGPSPDIEPQAPETAPEPDPPSGEIIEEIGDDDEVEADTDTETEE